MQLYSAALSFPILAKPASTVKYFLILQESIQPVRSYLQMKYCTIQCLLLDLPDIFARGCLLAPTVNYATTHGLLLLSRYPLTNKNADTFHSDLLLLTRGYLAAEVSALITRIETVLRDYVVLRLKVSDKLFALIYPQIFQFMVSV